MITDISPGTDSEAFATVQLTEQYKPELKSPGKSACEIAVVPISACTFDFELPPCENSYMVASYLLQRKSSSNVTGFNVSLRHRRKRNQAAETSTLGLGQDAELKGLMSHLWAVRKTAFAHGSQGTIRLIQTETVSLSRSKSKEALFLQALLISGSRRWCRLKSFPSEPAKMVQSLLIWSISLIRTVTLSF